MKNRLGIIAFVLALISVIFIAGIFFALFGLPQILSDSSVSRFISDFFMLIIILSPITFPFFIILFVISLICSILALREKNKKGRFYAWFSLIVSIIAIILLVSFLLLTGFKFTTF